MIYIKPKTVDELLTSLDKYDDFYIFCGGTDLVLKMKKDDIGGVIDISALDEFDFISKKDDSTLSIGALSTINSLLYSKEIEKNFPLLIDVVKDFASHQIRNVATIGGNIVNASPVADMIAPLLVLDSTVNLLGINGKRVIPLKNLLNGYKSLDIKKEIITSIDIPIKEHKYYYKKIGARDRLNISKLSLAMVNRRGEYYLSGASLNKYITRFSNVENELKLNGFNKEKILKSLEKDISPSGSFRSTKEYRIKVLLNMIEEGFKSFEK